MAAIAQMRDTAADRTLTWDAIGERGPSGARAAVRRNARAGCVDGARGLCTRPVHRDRCIGNLRSKGSVLPLRERKPGRRNTCVRQLTHSNKDGSSAVTNAAYLHEGRGCLRRATQVSRSGWRTGRQGTRGRTQLSGDTWIKPSRTGARARSAPRYCTSARASRTHWRGPGQFRRKATQVGEPAAFRGVQRLP